MTHTWQHVWAMPILLLGWHTMGVAWDGLGALGVAQLANVQCLGLWPHSGQQQPHAVPQPPRQNFDQSWGAFQVATWKCQFFGNLPWGPKGLRTGPLEGQNTGPMRQAPLWHMGWAQFLVPKLRPELRPELHPEFWASFVAKRCKTPPRMFWPNCQGFVAKAAPNLHRILWVFVSERGHATLALC